MTHHFGILDLKKMIIVHSQTISILLIPFIPKVSDFDLFKILGESIELDFAALLL